MITDGDKTIIESGAIVDYVLRHYGAGKLLPVNDSADFDAYQQWLHYSEGSAMLPLMLKLYVGRLGDAGAPLAPRINSEIANHLGFINRSLQGRDWLVGEALSIKARLPAGLGSRRTLFNGELRLASSD